MAHRNVAAVGLIHIRAQWNSYYRTRGFSRGRRPSYKYNRALNARPVPTSISFWNVLQTTCTLAHPRAIFYISSSYEKVFYCSRSNFNEQRFPIIEKSTFFSRNYLFANNVREFWDETRNTEEDVNFVAERAKFFNFKRGYFTPLSFFFPRVRSTWNLEHASILKYFIVEYFHLYRVSRNTPKNVDFVSRNSHFSWKAGRNIFCLIRPRNGRGIRLISKNPESIQSGPLRQEKTIPPRG